MITFSPLYKTLAKREMTLVSLAEKMGIRQSSLHDILKGQHTSVRQVEKICNILECGIDEVIEDDGQYEAGWESTLDEIDRRRNSDNHEIQRFVQDHPWLKGIDAKSARKILFPV